MLTRFAHALSRASDRNGSASCGRSQLLESVEPAPAPVHLLYTARDLAPLKLRKFIDFAVPALRQALLRIAGAA